MDPNEALKNLRDAMRRLGEWEAGLFPRPDLDEAITDATEAWESLDGWLKRDGFLPADWQSDDEKAARAMSAEAMADLMAMHEEPLDPELAEWLRESESFGQVLKHPLVNQIIVIPGLANRTLRAKQEALAEAEDAEDWHAAVFLHERPYRCDALVDYVVGRGENDEVLSLAGHLAGDPRPRRRRLGRLREHPPVHGGVDRDVRRRLSGSAPRPSAQRSTRCPTRSPHGAGTSTTAAGATPPTRRSPSSSRPASVPRTRSSRCRSPSRRCSAT